MLAIPLGHEWVGGLARILPKACKLLIKLKMVIWRPKALTILGSNLIVSAIVNPVEQLLIRPGRDAYLQASNFAMEGALVVEILFRF